MDTRLKDFVRANMRAFWNDRMDEIRDASDISSNMHDKLFQGTRSQNPLPLTKIKRIMKSDEEVKMVGADAAVLFAKACEIFIMELTLRAWLCKRENLRHTVWRCDIEQAIRNEELLSIFLSEVVPLTEQKEELNHPRETERNPAYPVCIQNISQPEDLNPFKKTRLHLDHPKHLHILNPAWMRRNTEVPLFPPRMLSVPVPSIYDLDFKEGPNHVKDTQICLDLQCGLRTCIHRPSSKERNS